MDSFSSGLVLSGSVGDGPVTGADIRVVDANGKLVQEGASDSSARYRLEIPDGTRLPVTVTATGGIDLVTGRTLDFELSALALESGPLNVNLSPYTTLASRAALCRRATTREDLTGALRDVLPAIEADVNFGWDRALQSDPVSGEVTAGNVAMVLLSNEALGELIRRTTGALAGTSASVSADELMEMLACDVADGRLDGFGSGVDPRVIATAHGTAVGVQFEVLAGALHVDNQNAVPLLDDALRVIKTDSQSSVQDAPILEAQIRSLRTGLALMGEVFERNEFEPLRAALSEVTPQNARTVARVSLTTQTRNMLAQFPEQVALASEQELDALAAQRELIADVSPPVLSLFADAVEVPSGQTTRLSWASSGAEHCRASGSWTGERATDGIFRTPVLQERTSYQLDCFSLAGSTSATVVVNVTGAAPVQSPEPAPSNLAALAQPTVTLQSAASSLVNGTSTRLSWTSTNAANCVASGAWSGSRGRNGTTTVGPLSNTSDFVLTCAGEGGSATSRVTVTVTAAPTPPPPPSPPASAPARTPQLSFSSADSTVSAGGKTRLTWSSSDTTSCSASGGWSGVRGTSGSLMVGPLNTSSTFSLSCSGPGGNVLRMLTVSMLGQVSLNWVAPTRNVDGSPLNDLAGYRIYYGQTSRNYPDVVTVGNAATTSHKLALASGRYYVAMTALDASGDESDYSNEVIKIVQ